MKILHLVNHCRLGHGNAHLAVDLACIQARKGDRVAYASEGGELETVMTQAGVEHILLRQHTKKPGEVLRSGLRLRRLIARRRFDIVHAHMMSGAVIGYFATRFSRAKLVTTVHNSFDSHSKLMRLGDAVAAVSEDERRILIARGFDRDRITTILNATLGGERSSALAAEEDIAVMRPAITTVCGLHARKGVDTVIDAFATIAGRFDVSLNIVGDGPDRTHLEERARRTGFGDRIRFHGSLSDPGAVLRQSDIFVLASHAEPLGLVNIEARAAGCAIVASDVGGIPEALDGGAAGLLVPPGDVAGFSEALAGLLSDPSRLADMKARARSNLERFSIDALYRGYDQLYGTVTIR